MRRPVKVLSTMRRLVPKAFSRWSDHEGQRLGAALAFYSILSAAPLLVLAVFLTSSVLGRQAAEQRLVSFAQRNLGPTGAVVVQSVMHHALRVHHSNWAVGIALVLLLFGASGAFLELRDDLNKMWETRTRSSGILGLILQRFFAFLLVLAAGILALASMLATAALSVITHFFHNIAPVPPVLLEILNFIVSVFLLAVVFVLVFRFVPDRHLPLKCLWPGALVTAVLFTAGKALLGIYLMRFGVGSAYGAAGSVVALAFFLYYAAQIFLFGAELTYLWAKRILQSSGEALAPS